MSFDRLKLGIDPISRPEGGLEIAAILGRARLAVVLRIELMGRSGDRKDDRRWAGDQQDQVLERQGVLRQSYRPARERGRERPFRSRSSSLGGRGARAARNKPRQATP
jgi:hypothetical protein